MKIEPSTPELIEAYVYGAVGAIQGVYKHVIQPELKDQPIFLYAFCGLIGGLAVNRLLQHLE